MSPSDPASIAREAMDAARAAAGAGAGLPPVPPFPVEALPRPLARYVREGAAALPCPPDFLAVPMLAVLGVAIGQGRALLVKQGWFERARVFAGVVGDPGSKKSPALALALAPLQDWQRAQFEAHDEALAEHERARVAHEVDLTRWKEARRKSPETAGSPPEAPQAPTLAQAVTTDATVESIVELLAGYPRGLLYAADELSGWVLALNQYKGGKGSDQSSWLSFWSGAAVTVNRKKSPRPLYVPHPYVCVAGCIPPDVLADLFDGRGAEDGFVHRVLLTYPDPVELRWTENGVSDEARAGYRQVVSSLMDDTAERLWRMRGPARERWAAWADGLYREIQAAPPELRGPLAKIEGYGLRLALIMAETRAAAGEGDAGPEEVDEASVAAGLAIADYFRGHLARVYGRMRGVPIEVPIEAPALAWVRRNGGSATARDLQRNGVAGCESADKARAVLDELVQQGAGQIEPTSGGGTRFILDGHPTPDSQAETPAIGNERTVGCLPDTTRQSAAEPARPSGDRRVATRQLNKPLCRKIPVSVGCRVDFADERGAMREAAAPAHALPTRAEVLDLFADFDPIEASDERPGTLVETLTEWPDGGAWIERAPGRPVALAGGPVLGCGHSEPWRSAAGLMRCRRCHPPAPGAEERPSA